MPCRISVFSGRKREKSPCENPPNGDFGGFSHGDLSPRQAKIRQTRAVTNPKKNSDPDPNPNEVSCRISDPDPIIQFFI